MTVPKLLGGPIISKVITAGWSNIDRFYPVDALVKVAAQFTPGLGDFSFIGEDRGLRPKLEDISHRANRLTLRADNTELWAEVQLLDTHAGRLVYDLWPKGNIKFDVMIAGKLNHCNEVRVDTINYMRVIAYGTYNTNKGLRLR